MTADPHAAKRAVAALRLASYEAELARSMRRVLHAHRADTLAQVRTQTAALFVAPRGTSLSDDLAEAARESATSVYSKILTAIGRLFPTVELPPYDLTGRLERLDYLVGELGADTVASVGATLTTGANLGEGIVDLSKRVRDTFDSSDRQADLIARFEVVGGANEAAVAQAGEAQDLLGVPLTKAWLSAQDERVRPTHEEADGQEVGLDDAFEVGADLLMYPGDPDGSAEEILGCRCTCIFSDGSEQASDEG